MKTIEVHVNHVLNKTTIDRSQKLNAVIRLSENFNISAELLEIVIF